MSKRSDDCNRGRGEHTAHLYSSFAEQKAALLPFLRRGLENRERCILVTGDSPDDWCFELQAYGIDVKARRQEGALQLVGRKQWRRHEEFNSILQARIAMGLVERPQQDFDGVRIVFDAGWALEPDLEPERLCHWEATSNLIYLGQGVRAVCQYNLEAHSPAAIHAALRTHSTVLIDGVRHTNCFYEAPRILSKEPRLNRSRADAREVAAMVDKLRASEG